MCVTPTQNSCLKLVLMMKNMAICKDITICILRRLDMLLYFDGFVQDCRVSSVLTIEILQH